MCNMVRFSDTRTNKRPIEQPQNIRTHHVTTETLLERCFTTVVPEHGAWQRSMRRFRPRVGKPDASSQTTIPHKLQTGPTDIWQSYQRNVFIVPADMMQEREHAKLRRDQLLTATLRCVRVTSELPRTQRESACRPRAGSAGPGRPRALATLSNYRRAGTIVREVPRGTAPASVATCHTQVHRQLTCVFL
ncbi:hypothetical protein CBL_00671 [Carabus blaptoides fortunei]